MQLLENVGNKDLCLMMKDQVIMRVNFDEAHFDVLQKDLLPWTLQSQILPPLPQKETYTKYDLTQQLVRYRKNYEALISWLSSRILSLSRDNAKKIYNLFNYPQLQDEISKSKIALVCRAVSLQDNYWVKLQEDTKSWKDVNLRTNKLNEVVAQVALHGSSLTLAGELTTPELTGQGAYAKAWKRVDNELWLYKKGAKDPTESKIEVLVSHLLDNCNVSHLLYEKAYDNDIYCCRCKCMTTEDISILSGMDFTSYCNQNNLNAYTEALRIDADSIYKMWIVDYLISNRDRHGLNWGFFYNCNTMEILGCHPLYDHNNSFDKDLMTDRNAPYLYDNRYTMREAAIEAMKHVDFHFYQEFTREDFITDRQYKSFMSKAKELKIPIKAKETLIYSPLEEQDRC